MQAIEFSLRVLLLSGVKVAGVEFSVFSRQLSVGEIALRSSYSCVQ